MALQQTEESTRRENKADRTPTETHLSAEVLASYSCQSTTVSQASSAKTTELVLLTRAIIRHGVTSPRESTVSLDPPAKRSALVRKQEFCERGQLGARQEYLRSASKATCG